MAFIKFMTEMTLKEFQAKGGKNRWRGKSAQERTEEMRRVARVRWQNHIKLISGNNTNLE